MPTESQIEKDIKNLFWGKGYFAERLHCGKSKGFQGGIMVHARAGAPDLVGCYDGEFMGIEVKNGPEELKKWYNLLERYEGGELLPKSYKRELNQFMARDTIIGSGGHYICVCNLQQVMEYIKEHL